MLAACVGNRRFDRKDSHMHLRLIAWVVTGAMSVLAMDARPAHGGTPKRANDGVVTPQQARKTIERALTFLENDALKWRSERGCATCHHGTMTVWALSEAKSQGYTVNGDKLADMTKWTKDLFVPRF